MHKENRRGKTICVLLTYGLEKRGQGGGGEKREERGGARDSEEGGRRKRECECEYLCVLVRLSERMYM